MLAIYDPAIATAYAIESIRLYDHYRFAGIRDSDGIETSSIKLKSTDEWVKPYYEPDNFKFKERQSLSLPLSRQ